MSYLDQQKPKPLMIRPKPHLFLLAIAKQEAKALGAMSERILVQYIEDYIEKNPITDETWEKVAEWLSNSSTTYTAEDIRCEW